MSFIPIMRYLVGLAFFGFIYWILDGLLDLFINEGVHVTGTTFNIIHALWTAGLLVYMIFGGWWAIRTYNEQGQQQGGIIR